MRLDRRIKEIGIYGISSVLRQAVGFIMLPIYTRYLSPEDYGVIGLLSVTVFFFELFFGARFASAVLRYYGDEELGSKDNVISTALVSTIVLSTIGIFFIIFNAEYLGGVVFREAGYSLYIKIYSTMLLATGLEYYGLMYLRLLNKALSFFYLSISKLILQIILNVYLIIYLEMGVMGFILSSVISTILYAGYLCYFMAIRCGLYFDALLFKKMFLYSWPLWIAGGVSLFNSMGNRYFINILSGLGDVGLFELGYKFSSLILTLFWNPFENWWQVERYKIFRSGEFGSNYQDVYMLLVLILSVLCVGSVYFSWAIISIMSSDEFIGSVFVVPPLSLSVAFFCLIQFFGFNFFVKDKTWVLLLYKVATGIALVLLYFLFVPLMGFVGAGISMAIVNLIIVVLMYEHGKRVVDLKVKLSAGFIPLMYSLTFVSMWYAVQYYYGNDFTALLIDMALYCLFLFVIYMHYKAVVYKFVKIFII